MGDRVGPPFELLEIRLGFGEKAQRALVSGDQLVERCGASGELANRLLEAGKQLLEPHGRDRRVLAQIVVAATLPRMPLTKRPASSPENVLASSMDSLIAALVGTWRSIAIS